MCLPYSGFSQAKGGLMATNRIELSKLKGGFDMMAYEAGSGRMFISASDNHSIEVVNLKRNRFVTSIPGFNDPKEIFYYPLKNVLYLATGKEGKVKEIDAVNYRTIRIYSFKEKCNNLRFDPQTNQLFVGVGDTFGEIGIIDLNKNQITGHIALAGSPRQFELTNDLILVNIPKHNRVQVIDRKESKVMRNWLVKGNMDNVPMAIDRKKQLLYVGRTEGYLHIYSTVTGKELGRAAINKDVKSIYLDTLHSQLYISCGEGFVNVFKIRPRRLTLIQKIPTRRGAGSALFIPETNQYVVSEPQKGMIPAAIQIFQPAYK